MTASRRRDRTGRLLATTAAVVLLVAACSESTTDDTDGTDGASSPEPAATTTAAEPETRTTRGVTDTTVEVGGVIWAVQFGGADVGAAARFARANREGGVHGRTIELVGVEDDRADIGTNRDATTRLVQQEEVFAIVPMVTSSVSPDFLLDHDVPFFGWGVDPAFCGNTVGFGFTGCVTDPNLERGSNALGTVLAAHFDGDTDRTVALIAADNDSGRGGLRLLEGSLVDIGFDVVYADTPVPAPPIETADYSPFVNTLLGAAGGAPPDVIVLTLATGQSISMAGALQDAGYDGLVITPSYDPRLLANESSRRALEGTGVLIQIAPYESADEIPALPRMIDDVRAHDPEALLTLPLAAGYWSADLFLAVLEATGPDLTVERFLETANSGFEWEAPGVVGPSTWPLNHDEPVPCASLAAVRDGAYVPDVGFSCGDVVDVG